MPSSPSPYVTLISSDGFEFIVRRESAYVAGPIKKMLDPTSQCSLPEMIGAGIVQQRRPWWIPNLKPRENRHTIKTSEGKSLLKIQERVELIELDSCR